MTWSQQGYLKASNPSLGDGFGKAVAVSGNTIVVGAPHEESLAREINQDGADDSAINVGAAYVFDRSGTPQWRQQAYLKASNSELGDSFGSSVAIFTDTVVVGAPGEDSRSFNIDEGLGDNSLSSAGAAYIFVRDILKTWNEQAYLKPSNPDRFDQFGHTVSIWGSVALVGTPWENSTGTGVNSPDRGNRFTDSGAAYAFERSNVDDWVQSAYLKQSNTELGDKFGTSVAISGSLIAVGAPEEDSSFAGVGGNGTDNDARDSGAAYIFNLGRPDDAVPGRIEKVQFNGTQFVIEFTGESNASGWRFTGSSDLNSFDDDLTSASTVMETGPGTYRATINLEGGSGRRFIRLER